MRVVKSLVGWVFLSSLEITFVTVGWAILALSGEAGRAAYRRGAVNAVLSGIPPEGIQAIRRPVKDSDFRLRGFYLRLLTSLVGDGDARSILGSGVSS
tara:strand:- start:2904 stop:3197 length:294 start_codon:yes stop_codon:yes gene_type:complete